MLDSILDTIKKMLGILDTFTSFDADIIVLINSAFASLNQLNIGPDIVFSISDNSIVWNSFTDEPSYIAMVQNYIYLKVKLGFDPPTTSFAINSIENQIRELEHRLLIQSDFINYVPEVPPEV